MKQRTLILVPFPFSDQSGLKVRPALVISNDTYNNESKDIIVAAVTSNITSSQYSMKIEQRDLDEGVLHAPSAIKIDSILKISKTRVIKSIGAVNASTFSAIGKNVRELFKTTPR